MMPFGYTSASTKAVLNNLHDLLAVNGIVCTERSSSNGILIFQAASGKVVLKVRHGFIDDFFSLPDDEYFRLHAAMIISGCKPYGPMVTESWPCRWLIANRLQKVESIAEALKVDLVARVGEAGLVRIRGEPYLIGLAINAVGQLSSFLCAERPESSDPLTAWSEAIRCLQPIGFVSQARINPQP